MANHPSALKRMRQNEKKRVRNMSYRSRVRTSVKKFLLSCGENKSESPELLSMATSLLHMGVSKGIYHKNTASRTIARLSRRLPSV